MVQQCEKLFNQNDRLLKHVEVSISNVKKAQKDQIAKRQKETQRRQEVVEKIDTSVPLIQHLHSQRTTLSQTMKTQSDSSRI